MVDFSQQRANMVESQVRPSDISDRRVIRAMAEVAREAFLPPALRPIAYQDNSIPLGGGRQLLAPRSLAKLVQALDIGDGALVLVVGAPTGYDAAIIARIAQTVVALECEGELAEATAAALNRHGVDNAAVVTGPLADGYADEGPYDGILVSGPIELMPDALLDQLKDGGRLVAIQSENGIGRARQWRRSGAAFGVRVLFDAGVDSILPGFVRERTFSL